MAKTAHAKVIIIGSGPAGYTAAIYAARAMLQPLLIQGLQAGGQLTITTDVENYPGFAEAIQGPWLMQQMQQQAEHVGTRVVTDLVAKADLSRRPFRLEGDDGDVYLADALIIATGAQARWLDLPAEQKFKGYGVSACATCDGFFYRGKEVIVVGGGNSAIEEALFLTNFATRVTIVHRRQSFRAEKVLQQRLFRNPKVDVLWDTALDDVIGTDDPIRVIGVRLRNTKTGITTERHVDGVFIAIGHTPASDLFAGQLEMKQGGLHQDRAKFDRDIDFGRIRRRRRDRRRLPSGRHRCRPGMHGGAGSRALFGGARGRESRRRIGLEGRYDARFHERPDR
jgi:thioredoxin reductase (NADPH)